MDFMKIAFIVILPKQIRAPGQGENPTRDGVGLMRT
jgi:hypothetical protein